MKKNVGDIAIIGLSCKFPEATDQFEFWERLQSNEDCISNIPEERWEWQNYWDGSRGKDSQSKHLRGGFIKDADAFDNDFFGLIPKVVEAMDPQQRIMLELAWKCLEDAGIAPSSLRGKQVGLVLSAFNHDYKELQDKHSTSSIEAHYSTGNAASIIANRVSHYFDFKGPSLLIDTACSGSLNAIHCAVQAIGFGDCEMALAGGVNLIFTPNRQQSFTKMGMMSPTGTCRSFDESANGYVRGEGAGLILLKPLQKALEDNNAIYGVIKGTAVNHCGDTYTMTYPSAQAQAAVIVDAHRRAGVGIDTISYIEAHGTGTPKGDPIEFQGLELAFEQLSQEQDTALDNHYCGIGSAKSNIGHLESAAGVAGVIKVLMQMRSRQLPAVHHFNKINPRIAIDKSPFFIVDSNQPWQASLADDAPLSRPLRAGVSSFGFGGTNSHVVLEEAPPAAIRKGHVNTADHASICFPVPLSAKSDSALKTRIVELREWLARPDVLSNPDVSVADISHTLSVGRDHFSHRTAYLCSSKDDLLSQLRQFDETLSLREQAAISFDQDGSVPQALQESVQAYLAGEAVEWFGLYAAVPVATQRIPTYPFAKNRFWVSDQTDREALASQLHPLVHQNVSDFECQSYRCSFRGDEFFLKDHHVYGEPILPGAAYLEMVVQAVMVSASVAVGEKTLAFNQVAWLRPITKASLGDIAVSLYPLEFGTHATESKPGLFNIEFEITSQSVTGESVIHCQGGVSLSDKASAAEYQAAESDFSDRCAGVLGAEQSIRCGHDQLYRLMNVAGLEYGSAHTGLSALSVFNRQAVAYVHLPESVHNADRHRFCAHPSLLDAVIQSAVALVWSEQCQSTAEQMALFSDTNTASAVQAQLPFLLDNAVLHSPLSDSLCVALMSTGDSTDRVHGIDIVVANVGDDNNIVDIALTMTGLTLRALPQAATHEIAEADAVTHDTDAAAQKPIHPQLTADNSEGYYAPQWVEQAAAPEGQLANQAGAVVLAVSSGGQSSIPDSLIQRFVTSGMRVVQLIVSDDYSALDEQLVAHVRASEEDDFVRFVADLKNRQSIPDLVVHQPPKVPTLSSEHTPDAVEHALDAGIKALFLLVKSLIKPAKKLRCLTLVEGEVLTQPHYLGLSGFYKSLSLEKPSFSGRVVQYANHNKLDVADLILREWLDTARHTDIAYLADQRFVRYFDDCASVLNEVSASQAPFGIGDSQSSDSAGFVQGGVYVITGGMGALGLIFARHLLQQYEARVYLTGRAPTDSHKQAQLDTLNAPGQGKAVYLCCDVNDRASVNASIETIRADSGRLDGILHSAGVIEDNFIIRKPYASFVKVITPKSTGTINLDQATAKDDLSCFIVFSSVTGVLGNLGQCDYAFGNAFEDYFSLHRNQLVASGLRKGRSLAINWPYWRNGGMVLSDKEEQILNKNFGIVPLETQAGIEAIETALQLPFSQLAVMPGNATKVREVLGCIKPSGAAEAQRSEALRSQVVLSDPSDLAARAADYLIDLFSTEMKVSRERFTLEGSFSEFGFDSVVMLEMIDLMEKRFAGLPKTLFFECQNINDLSAFLVENYPDQLAGDAAQVESGATEYASAVVPPANTSTHKRLARTGLYEGHGAPTQRDNRIAVVGLAGRYPEAGNPEEFWQNLANGVDCIREIPEERWDIDKVFREGEARQGKSYSKWGGFLDNVDKFDALFFNISPKEAEKLDPQERLFLEVVGHAIEDAGYHPDNLASRIGHSENPVGVYTGVMWGDYQLFGIESADSDDWLTPRSFYWSIANRVSYFYNFSGPSITLDTACSSSLTALHLACKAIHAGEVSVAIAGGVNLSIHPQKYNLLSDMHFLSSDGRCRSFGEGGSGYVPGECVSAVVLKSLAEAERDGDHIYGVIRGTSVNHGGKVSGFTVPNPLRQAALIRDALDAAQVNPRHISYVEAHGTGTSLGDPLEISGLSRAYAQSDAQYCAIGSAKSNIGHAEAAAGLAGLSKVLMQLKYKALAPSLHSETLNANIDFEHSPFKVNQALRPWDRPVVVNENGERVEIPRIAGLSSFGAGGSNGHVIIEEYMAEPSLRAGADMPLLVPLSAKTRQALMDGVDNLIRYLDTHPEVNLSSFAYTLQTGRVEFGWRVAVVCHSQSHLLEQLNTFRTRQAGAEADGIFYSDVAVKASRDAEKVVAGPHAGLQDEGAIKAIAQSWVAGSAVSWMSFYGASKPNRLPLPGYAYQRRRYWIDKVASGKTQTGLHPVLHRNISTLATIAYQTEFSPSDFFIKHHKINHNGVLPGVVYLEMAFQAIAHALPESQLESIYDIQWLRPVVVNEGSDNNRYVVAVEEDRYGYTFSIFNAADPQRKAYCRGGFGVIPQPVVDDKDRLTDILRTLDPGGLRGKEFDINELKRVGPSMAISTLDATFETMGFNFGDAFKPFAQMYRSEEEAFARLVLPESALAQSDGFVLDPVLLDGALRTSIGIGSDDARSSLTPLPVSLGRLQVFRALVRDIYVYARKKLASQSVPGRDVFNIYLLDGDGNVLIYLEGFETQKVPGFLANNQSARKVDQPPLENPAPEATEKSDVSVSSSRASTAVSEYELEAASLAYFKALLSEQTLVPVAEIDESASLDSYGIESLMVHAINEKLNNTFGDEVSKTLLYEYETIAEVATYLAENFPSVVAGFVSAQASPTREHPAPAHATASASAASVAAGASDEAASRVEEFLIQQIAGVTGLAIADLSVSEPFDNYGIDSLSINTLNQNIASVFGDDVSKTLFYEYEDIESLVAYFVENHAHSFVNLPSDGVLPSGDSQSGNTTTTDPESADATSGDSSAEALQKKQLARYLSYSLGRLLDTGAARKLDLQGEFALDDIQQIRLSSLLRTELQLQADSSVLQAFSIEQMVERLSQTQQIDSDLLVQFNRSLDEPAESGSARQPPVGQLAGPQQSQAQTHASRRLLAGLLETKLGRVAVSFQQQQNDDIAIIGLSGRYPLADDVAQFWSNLVEGRDCIREIPTQRWDHARYFNEDRSAKGFVYSKWGGFMDGVDLFDAEFFKMTRREAEISDPQERLFLQTAWQCLEDAAYTRGSLANASVGVFAGVMWGDYQLIDVSEQQKQFGRPAASFSSIANRVSYFFDFHGPSLALDSMCSSSLSAIHTACQSIRAGDCDYAIAGGVNVSAHVNKYQLLCQQQFLSDDGRCRAFGEGGSGYVPGEGAGAVLLKPLHQAEADGDNIYAVIKGSALNHGGKTSGFTVPNQRAQSNVIGKALARSGWSTDSIQYVEAHGTGTSLGDPIELSGLTKVFSENQQQARSRACYLGSVKSNIGHLESAAGIAGLTKVLLQMRHGVIAPSLHSAQLNPNLSLDKDRFEVPQQALEWRRRLDSDGGELPRRAGLSAFGAGGSNAHFLIEEHIRTQAAAWQPEYLFVLSADTPDRLRDYVDTMAEFINGQFFDDTASSYRFLSNLSFTSLMGREQRKVRLAIVCSKMSQLKELLTAYRSNIRKKGWYSGGENLNGVGLGDIVDNETRYLLLESLFKPGRMDDLAKVWVSSMDVNWAEHLKTLFAKDSPMRISMPSQPLRLERHWVDEKRYESSAAKENAVHELLDANISTIDQQAFRKTFTGNEFYIKDHQVENDGPQKILPGVAYLEMAYAAATASVPEDYTVCKISDVVWFAPIRLDSQPEQIKVALSRKGDGLEYHVTDLHEQSKLYSSGEIEFSNGSMRPGEQWLDIQAIQSRAGTLEERDEIYRQFRDMGFYYGAAYQVTDWRLRQSSSAFARLSLPEGLNAQAGAFVLHPSLMDAALRSCLAIGNEHYSSPMVPFSLGEIEVLAPLVDECFVYASSTPVEGDLAAGSDSRQFDLVITDLQGRILVRINRITARSFEGRKTESLNYYSYAWKRAAIETADGTSPAGMLVFVQDESSIARYQSHFTAATLKWAMPGEGYAQRDGSVYTLRTDEPEDYQALFDALDDEGFQLSHVVNLLGSGEGLVFDEHSERRDVAISQALKHTHTLAYSVFRIIEQRYPDASVRFLDIEMLRGEKRSPFKASLMGFANSMVSVNHRFQMASLSLQETDLDQLGQLITTLVAAPRVNGQEYRLASNGQELQQRMLVLREASAEEVGGPEAIIAGTCVITGGLGKLGLAIAEHLAASGRCNLVLVSRSEPTSEQQQAIGRIREQLANTASGRTISTAQADISDARSVEALFEQIAAEQLAIDGIIHAAGQVATQTLPELSWEEYLAGLKAKIHGLIHLDACCRQYGVSLIVNFSSVSAQMGDTGSGNYASGNRFLDEYAHNHPGADTQMISINFPLWQSGGMQIPEEEIASLKFSGMVPMPQASGLQAFDDALRLSEANRQLFVLYGDQRRTEKKFGVYSEKPWMQVTAKPHKALPVTALAAKQPQTVESAGMGSVALDRVSAWVKQCIASVTLQEVTRINNTDTFESFGMDSVLLMECQSMLAEQVGGLPKTILFEEDSVEKLSGYLLANKAEEMRQALILSDEATNDERSADQTATVSQTQGRSATPPDALKEAGEEPSAPGSVSVAGLQPEGGVVSIGHLFARNESPYVLKNSPGAAQQPGTEHQSLAIIGMAGRFPEANDLVAFWDNLVTGKNCIRALPEKRWRHGRAASANEHSRESLDPVFGGFLDDVDGFDHGFFGMSRLEAGRMDPQLRVLLESVWHAMEDAAYTKEALARTDLGVFVGAMNNDHTHVSHELSLEHEVYVGPGSVDSELANRISYVLDVYGPSVTVKTACSSSMTALHLACNAIRAGDCRVAIVAGINLSLHAHKYQMLQDMKVLSPSDTEKTFDLNADGLIPSEGVGVLILKSEPQAVEANDNIHALIQATAASHSGVGAGQFIPNIKVLENTMQACLQKAGVEAGKIGYVESHGTATALGDPIELRAIENFASNNGIKDLNVGTKASLGHMEAASTLCSLIKVVLSLKNKTIVPCANLTQLSDAIDAQSSPLRLNSTALPWAQNDDGSRVAGVHSFGMGGSNGFAIVSSAPAATTPASTETPIPIVVFSANSPEQLQQVVANSLRQLVFVRDVEGAMPQLASVAYTSQCGRKAYVQRVAFIASDPGQLMQLMSVFVDAQSPDNQNIVRGSEAQLKEASVVELLNRMGGSEFYQRLFEARQWVELARLWVTGVDIDWQSLYTGPLPRKTSLAGYPFRKTDCSIASVLDQIKSIELKKQAERQSKRLSQSSHCEADIAWYPLPMGRLSGSLPTGKGSKKQVAHYWRQQQIESDTHLCANLNRQPGDTGKQTEAATSTVLESDVTLLKRLSSQNRLSIQSLCLAAWAIVLNRNTRVKAPSFAFRASDEAVESDVAQPVLPVTVKTAVRTKCLPWLLELQAVLEQHMLHSKVADEVIDPARLRNATRWDAVDTALLVSTGTGMLSQAGEQFRMVASVHCLDEAIRVSVQCSDVSVTPDEVNRILQEFVHVLSNLHGFTDKLPAAISVKDNKKQMQDVMNRLEGM